MLNCIFIIHAKPYESRGANRVEVFNEVTILLVALHLYTFTEFVPYAELQTYSGYSLICVVLINVLYHLVCMVAITLRSMCLLVVKLCNRRVRPWLRSRAQKEAGFQGLPSETIEPI